MRSSPAPLPSGSAKRHWAAASKTRGAREVSWYQPEPEMSLALIEELGLARDAAIVDVGTGASSLAARDCWPGASPTSPRSISQPERMSWLAPSWEPRRLASTWSSRICWLGHRRADTTSGTTAPSFTFWSIQLQQERYAEILRSTLRPGGKVVIGTFAADGPTTCSGVPVARYDADRLATAFGKVFARLATSREEHRTPAKSIQPFTWVTLERTR